MQIKVSNLSKLVKKALKKYGYSPKEIKIIHEVLLYAQLRGNNQGVVKLIGKGIPKSPEAKEIEVTKETKLSVLLNGNNNMGMVVMKYAMEKALKAFNKVNCLITSVSLYKSILIFTKNLLS